MDNVDSLLTKLFHSLQVLDPTNYIPQNEAIVASLSTTESQLNMSNVASASAAASNPAPAPAPAPAPTAAAPVPASLATPTEDPVTPVLVRCPICLDDVPPSHILVPGPCTHGFCRDCLTTQATIAARAKRAPLPCASCGNSLDATAILPLLTPENAALLSTALAHAVAGFVRHCAFCNEAVSGGLATFTCPRCGKLNGPREDDTLAALAAAKGWIPCPGCGNLASKDNSWSCNYTQCICGVSFCLRCGERYVRAGSSSNNPGTSNQHGTPGCSCGLYEK